MTQGIKAQFGELRTIAFGAIGATYAVLGSPITENARVLAITNTCDAEMLISIDGTTDHIRLPINGFKLFDISTNTKTEFGFTFPKNLQIYIKYASAPASGNVWVEYLYGNEA